MKYLNFLTSPRFWMIVSAAVASYLKSAGFELDPNALADSFMIIAGGGVAVNTVDRLKPTS